MISNEALRDILNKLFLRDWTLKFVALSITIALWLSVGGLRSPVSKRISGIPLNLSYSPEMELVNASIKEVDIIVTGDKTKIEKLRGKDLVILVDLSHLKPGEKTVYLTPETVSIELPSGVKIEEIQPNKILVKLEKIEEREVPVKPDFEGNPAKDFEIYSYSVSPSKVLVRGPESYVKAIESISTEKIDIENCQKSITIKNVGLSVMNPKIRLLETSVDVSLQVGEKRFEQTFSISYEIQNKKKTASVVLFAPRSILEKISAKDLKISMSENKVSVILPKEFEEKIEVKSVKTK